MDTDEVPNRRKEDKECYKLSSRLDIVENNIADLRRELDAMRNEIRIDVSSLEESLNTNNVLMAKLDGIEKGRMQLLLIASNAISWAIGYFQDRIIALFK